MWYEWIGIWGSGKSTEIRAFAKRCKEASQCVTTASDTNRLSRISKIINVTTNVTKLLRLLLLSVILFRIILFTCITGNSRQYSLLRSLLSCYLARLSVNQIEARNVLWEGEIHILPLLDITDLEMSILVRVISYTNTDKKTKFIIKKIPIELSLARIKKDQLEGRNIRFPSGQIPTYNELKEIDKRQDKLVTILINAGFEVHNSLNIQTALLEMKY